MNTNLVKNILLVLFGIITIALGALILIQENRYNLSAAQETAVVNLLEQNNIYLHGEIIRNFRPMRPMAMERYGYDRDGLAARFFYGSEQPVNVYIEGNNMVFYTDDREMSYSYLDNIIVFEIPDGITNAAFAASPGGATAEQLAIEYIEALMGMPPDMELFSNTLDHFGNYIISFFTSYRGHILYNDHIRVRVTDRGITSIFYSRIHERNRGFVGEPHSIFSADEAMFALLNHLRQKGVEGHVIINEMKLAYFLYEDGGQSIGIPVYVFTIDLGRGLRFNYIFNAYTNEDIRHEIIR